MKQLRIVSAIARTGRVLGAAEMLNVTPPAVTLQLKQLEEALGLPMFERARDGMKPTAAGQLILESANRIEAELGVCAEGLAAMRGLKGGSVSVGVVSTAKYFAPAALGAFNRLHPELDLKLMVSNREDTIRELAELDFDIAIMGRPPQGLDVKSAIIGDHPHVIIAQTDHPLASQRGIDLERLSDEKFLVREEGSGTRNLMERIFAQIGVTPKVGMEISSNETIKQAVMAGLGIAFLSAHTIAAEIEGARLAILDVKGLPAWRQWRIVRHAEKRLTPPGAALWDFLVERGSDFLPVSHLVKREDASIWSDWDPD